MEKNKIGLLFGSFNPIHIGHTALSNYILEYSDLLEIWFIVTPQNPFKKDEKLIDESFRLEMTKLAIANEPRFKVSDIEFNLPKPSYTINTLETLKSRHPSKNFVLIMGSDNVLQIEQWKDSHKVTGNYDIIVYPRTNFLVNETSLPQRVTLINAPLLDISSTMIRNSFAEGKKLSFFLLTDVFEYIMKNNLYQNL